MHSLQLHVNCACTIDTSETPAFVCCLKNGVVLELCRTAAGQNPRSCQFADKWDERGHYKGIMRNFLPSATHAPSLKQNPQWLMKNNEWTQNLSAASHLRSRNCLLWDTMRLLWNHGAPAQDVFVYLIVSGVRAHFSSHYERRVHTEIKTNGSEVECTILN